MTSDLVELAMEDARSSPRRRAIWAVGSVLLLVGGSLTWLALRHRPANADVAYYLPSYVPPDFHTASAWSRDPTYGPQGPSGLVDRATTYYGGRVGSDGRLERWIDLDTNIRSFQGRRTIDVAGQPAWIVEIMSGELRLQLNVAGCAAVEASSVGLTEQELATVAATVRCEDGYAVVDPPKDQVELCRVKSLQDAAWGMEFQKGLAGPSNFSLTASQHDCPLVAMTGLLSGDERVENINGRPTVLHVDASDGFTWADASFRDGDMHLSVRAYFDGASLDPETELRRFVEGLRRVDAKTWHERNAMFPVAESRSDHG